MDNMHTSKGEQDLKDGTKGSKERAMIEKLKQEKIRLNNQLDLEKNKTVSVTRRFANPNKEASRELRKQMTEQIMSRRGEMLAKVANMPITDDML